MSTRRLFVGCLMASVLLLPLVAFAGSCGCQDSANCACETCREKGSCDCKEKKECNCKEDCGCKKSDKGVCGCEAGECECGCESGSCGCGS